MTVKKVLTVAGSDSGGGAGIQADLKTFAALGTYGCSVITALTAQNTLGVRAAAGVSPDLVGEQLDAVLSDIEADAVKTGMLYDADIIEVIVDRLKHYQVPCLVVDPVMVATSGDSLLNASGVEALREQLLPLASFATPNVDEASVLCGFPIQNTGGLYQAARELHHMGAKFVIITGIQKDNQCIDFCYDGREFQELKGPFLDTLNTHGTGCSFSAALAAYAARGASPWQAAVMAKKYIISGLRYAYPVGSGRGPLNHLATFFPGNLDDPEILEVRAQAFQDWGKKPELKPFPLLNLIIGGPLCKGKDYAELTRLAIKGGARLIQFREKEGDTRELVETAIKMREVCQANNAIFIVNDRVDVAAASGAHGVHVGQDDSSPQAARALLGPGKIIGVSVENLAQVEAAVAAGADYLGLGPVYPTTTKDCRVEACEPSLLAEAAARVPIPVIAIGGITPENTLPLLKAGASGVAVISAILGSPEPEQAIREFMKVFGKQRDGSPASNLF